MQTDFNLSAGVLLARMLTLAFTVVTLLCMTACTTHKVILEDTVPDPLIEPLDLNIGVFYSQALQDYSYTEQTKQGEKWILPVGAASMSVTDRMLTAMFAQVTPLETVTIETASNLDAILAPSIIDVDVLTPEESNSNFHQVTIQYRLRLLSTEAEMIADWPVTAFGRNRAPWVGVTSSIKRAADMALRDGAALFIVRFAEQPDVRAWLVKQGVIEEEVGPEAYPGADLENANETIDNDSGKSHEDS